ncbi:MAG: DUF1800 domain-containing protein [Phycisphaerales bacterium]
MMKHFAQYTPNAARPWNRKRAAHLLRRAGFAASEEEIQRALASDPATLVDNWLDGDAPAGTRHDELDVLGERLASRNDIAALRGWWLHRMCFSQQPLRMRISMMWHDHFATSHAKVQSALLMLKQLRLFEQHGMGSVQTLLLEVSRDPAMIIWLDGNDNAKGRPNENYARELFELFSLGVGNYTEADIKEAARAFTGWHEKSGAFHFVAHEHDDGDKRLFNNAVHGNLNGDDVVHAVIKHPACAVFIARLLLREFVTPLTSDAMTAELADIIRAHAFNINAVLNVMLRSEAMFAEEHYRARIKSPVELAVGIVRSLGLSVPADELATTTSNMGQRLFEPPSVKGWDGHRTWLNSTTMLVRLNAAIAASKRADGFLDRLGGSDDPKQTCIEILLDGNAPPVLATAINATSGDHEGLRAAVELALASPEYQMA